jgi:hypothetical protein
MTRALPLVAVALLAAVACSAPGPPEAASTPAPAPTPVPVAVYVQVPDEPEPAVEAWAQDFTAAILAGQGQLVLAPSPEEATATVRIDGVESGIEASPEPEGEGEITRMKGVLVVGESAREFSLVYRGEARPQAEALARNLRRFAAEGSAASPADASEESPEEGPDTDEGSADEESPEVGGQG